MPKNAKKEQQAAAEAERIQRELEELKKKLSEETRADMLVLRALLDADRRAQGIEQEAGDYSVGVERRLVEAEREIDAEVRERVRRAVEKDAAKAREEADGRIAAIRAEAEEKRSALVQRFEERRSEYGDKLFALVIGAADE